MIKWRSALMLILGLLWIPLSIAAFIVSPVRTDIKLTIGASASLIILVVFALAEEQ